MKTAETAAAFRATVSADASRAFRSAFESHPARHTDPALALDSARETAAELIPSYVTGSFDDEALTFTADPRPAGGGTCPECGAPMDLHDYGPDGAVLPCGEAQ